MVGLWQILVVDVVVMVILFSLNGMKIGEVMVMGEKLILVLIFFVVFVRMVVVESLLNFGVVDIKGGFYRGDFKCVKFFVNWMVVVNYFGEGVVFYEVVEVIGMEFCFKFGVSIFVGKDFILMKVSWKDGEIKKSVIVFVLVVIFVFILVEDVCCIWIFQFCCVEDVGEIVFFYVDLV